MLTIQNLTLKKEKKIILNKLNFKVKSGEIYAILGPNGAGKSSLAYSIMGCEDYQPSEGKIIFDGKIINNLSVWQRARLGITLAWQEPVRFEGITVEDYLSFGKNNKQVKIEEALKKVSLDPGEYLGRKIDNQLSGGERKRIELAAVFTMKPRLAILDEPDSGIDILTVDKIWEFICDLRKQGASVILITHSADAGRLAERASLIDKGYLIREGTAQEVLDFFENKCLVCPKFR